MHNMLRVRDTDHASRRLIRRAPADRLPRMTIVSHVFRTTNLMLEICLTNGRHSVARTRMRST
jgi:hypothetical protein